jgi:hypothetical protein
VVRRLAAQCAAGFPDGWTGRKLGTYLREAGLEAVRIEPATVVLHDLPTVLKAMNIGPFLDGAVDAGKIGEGERTALLAALADADANGTLLFAMTTFRAVGRRSAPG